MYTLKQLIKMTGLSERSIRRHIQLGKLKGIKIGGVWRFEEEDLKTYFTHAESHSKLKKQAGKDIVDFMESDNEFPIESALIIDLDKTKLKSVAGINKRVLSIVNNHPTKFTMRFYQEQNKHRYVITGDIDLIHKITSFMKEVQDERVI